MAHLYNLPKHILHGVLFNMTNVINYLLPSGCSFSSTFLRRVFRTITVAVGLGVSGFLGARLCYAHVNNEII